MFKTKYIKIITEGRTLVAIKKGIALYGKTFSGKYKIEWTPDFGLSGFAIPLYFGKTKPLFKDLWVITILFFIPSIIWVVLLVLFYFLFNYFNGMTNYIKDDIWQTNVKFFNNTNIILIIVFLILYLLE